MASAMAKGARIMPAIPSNDFGSGHGSSKCRWCLSKHGKGGHNSKKDCCRIDGANNFKVVVVRV